MQPRAEGFNAYSLVALASTIFIVSRDLSTRRIAKDISSLAVALANAIFVLVGALALSAFEGWVAVGWYELLLLGGASLFLIVGYPADRRCLPPWRHRHHQPVPLHRPGSGRWARATWSGAISLMRLAFAGIVIVVASRALRTLLHRERIPGTRRGATRSEPREIISLGQCSVGP